MFQDVKETTSPSDREAALAKARVGPGRRGIPHPVQTELKEGPQGPG